MTQKSKTDMELVDSDQHCACGLHTIPHHIVGIKWYWSHHTRRRCLLELPDVRCWCGRLRSEHQNQEGHDLTTRDAA